MAKIKLIGIAGTNGSGKNSLGKLLVADYGWKFISVTKLLRIEAKNRGLPIEREILRTISAEWRREYGLGVLVDKALEMYQKEPKKYNGLVMASLRNSGEADRIHELGGQMVWIDAEPSIRYERVTNRLRSSEDIKTFEEFLAEEKAEMEHSGDKATLDMAGVKAKSDIFLDNRGTTEEFKIAVKDTIKLK